jgi:hypothetical protein
MKQLYSSGPLAPPAGQPQTLRATSAGVSPEALYFALNHSGYVAPQRDGDGKLPVRLALLRTPQGRVLTHTQPNGTSYFAHTLLNVPPSADAQLAIQTWGSPLWQTHEPDGGRDLPELPYLPVADVLDDAGLRAWLATPARQEMLEFTLTALLGGGSSGTIYLGATADEVAHVVYAVTRMLPPGLLDDFTFSTYEANPLACSARLVGHDGDDLPDGCHATPNLAYHRATGRRTPFAADVPFAAFAVKAASNGDFGPVDEVKSTWDRLNLREPRQFDLVYRLTRGTGTLTQDEAAETLQHPPLAAWIAARADVLHQFLEWALEDRHFATQSFTRAVQALRQKPDVIAKLAQTVREAGLTALRANDRDRTATALEVVLPMIAPAKANAIWGELLTQLGDPDAVGWGMRGYLLPKFVRAKQHLGVTGVDVAVAPWVAAPADKLADLLALDLPKPYPLAAARSALLRDGEPSATLAATLSKHPPLALALLHPQETDADRAAKLYDALLAEAPAHPWLEDLLGRAADYPPLALNRYFEATLAAGKIDADRVIRTSGPRLLELFAGQSGLDKVGTQLLLSPPADLLRNAALLGFLTNLLDEPKVSEELKARVRAVTTVKAYLDAPTFDAPTLMLTASALAATPPVAPASAKPDLFDAVAKALLARANSPELQNDLEATLIHLGPVLAVDSTDLYENLLRDLRTRTDFGRHADLGGTFLAVALGATNSPDLAGKLDGLDGHAFAVASDAAKRGGSRVLAEIDRRAATWPKAAKTQWGFLSAAVRPRGAMGLVRDAGLVLVGVVAASAVWLVVMATK